MRKAGKGTEVGCDDCVKREKQNEIERKRQKGGARGWFRLSESAEQGGEVKYIKKSGKQDDGQSAQAITGHTHDHLGKFRDIYVPYL